MKIDKTQKKEVMEKKCNVCDIASDEGDRKELGCNECEDF